MSDNNKIASIDWGAIAKSAPAAPDWGAIARATPQESAPPAAPPAAPPSALESGAKAVGDAAQSALAGVSTGVGQVIDLANQNTPAAMGEAVASKAAGIPYQVPMISPTVDQFMKQFAPDKTAYTFGQSLPFQAGAALLTDGGSLVGNAFAGAVGGGGAEMGHQTMTGENNPLAVAAQTGLGGALGAGGYLAIKGAVAGGKFIASGATDLAAQANALKNKILPPSVGQPISPNAQLPNGDLLAGVNPDLHALVTGRSPRPAIAGGIANENFNPLAFDGPVGPAPMQGPANPYQTPNPYAEAGPINFQRPQSMPNDAVNPIRWDRPTEVPLSKPVPEDVPMPHEGGQPNAHAVGLGLREPVPSATGEAALIAEPYEKQPAYIILHNLGVQASIRAYEISQTAAQVRAAGFVQQAEQAWEEADAVAKAYAQAARMYATAHEGFVQFLKDIETNGASLVAKRSAEVQAKYDKVLEEAAIKHLVTPENIKAHLHQQKQEVNDQVVQSMLRVNERQHAEVVHACDQIIHNAETRKLFATASRTVHKDEPKFIPLIDQITGNKPTKVVADKKIKLPPPPAPLPPKPLGEYSLTPTQVGRAAMDKVPSLDVAARAVQGGNALVNAVKDIATKKAAMDHAKAVRDAFARKIYDKYGKDELAKQKLHINFKDVLVDNASRTQALRNEHFRLANGVEERTAGGAHFMMPQEFQTGDVPVAGQLPVRHYQLIGDVKQDAQRAALLQDQYNAAKTAFEQAKTPESKKLFEDANKVIKAKKPLDNFGATTDVPHPDKSIGGNVAVNIEMHQGQARLKALVGEVQDSYNAFVAKLDAALRHPDGSVKKTKTEMTNFNARSVVRKGATLAAFGGVASMDLDAKAANGQPENNNHIWMYVAAAGALALAAQTPIGKKALSKPLVLLGQLNRNSLDNMSWIDAAIKAMDAASGVRPVYDAWQQANAYIMQNSLGVELNDAMGQLATKIIQTGKLSVPQFLEANRVKDISTPFHQVAASLSPEAAQLVTKKIAAQQAFLQVVNQNIAYLEQAVKDGKLDASSFSRARFAIDDLKRMQKVLNGTADVDLNDLDKTLTAMMSTTMEHLFRLNPAHQAVNLTDPLFVGVLHIGTGEIIHAYKMLGNKEINAALSSALQTGSYGAAQAEVDAAQALNHSLLPRKKFDISADPVNAKVVTIAGAFHYFNYHPAEMKALGYSNSEAFVKDLFAGKVKNADVANEAWTGIATMNCSALGIDSMHLVTNLLGSTRAGKYLAVFVQQPARMARGLKIAIQNKNYAGVCAMLGMTTALGGSSAIPNDVGPIWMMADPDSFFEASLKLDQANIIRGMTRTDLGKKMDYATMAWPLMAASNPTVDTIQKALEHFEALSGAIDEMAAAPPGSTWNSKGNPAASKLWKALSLVISDVGMLAVPSVKGVPVRFAASGLRAAANENDGIMPVSVYRNGKRIGNRTDVPLDKTGMSHAEVDARKMLGMTSALESALTKSKLERAARPFARHLHYDEGLIMDNVAHHRDPLFNLH